MAKGRQQTTKSNKPKLTAKEKKAKRTERRAERRADPKRR